MLNTFLFISLPPRGVSLGGDGVRQDGPEVSPGFLTQPLQRKLSLALTCSWANCSNLPASYWLAANWSVRLTSLVYTDSSDKSGGCLSPLSTWKLTPLTELSDAQKPTFIIPSLPDYAIVGEKTSSGCWGGKLFVCWGCERITQPLMRFVTLISTSCNLMNMYGYIYMWTCRGADNWDVPLLKVHHGNREHLVNSRYIVVKICHFYYVEFLNHKSFFFTAQTLRLTQTHFDKLF